MVIGLEIIIFGALLNIEFNTHTDAKLCCEFLNREQKEKTDYAKLADKFFHEKEELEKENHKLKKLESNHPWIILNLMIVSVN